MTDPLIGSIVQDIFRELAENENCRQPLEDRLLPTIASILHSPDKVPVGMPSVGLKYVNSPKSQLDTTSCDKVCQWLAIGLWFSLDTPVSLPPWYNWNIVESGIKTSFETSFYFV